MIPELDSTLTTKACSIYTIPYFIELLNKFRTNDDYSIEQELDDEFSGFFVFLFLEKIFCIDAAGDAGSSGGYSDGNENGYKPFISSSK